MLLGAALLAIICSISSSVRCRPRSVMIPPGCTENDCTPAPPKRWASPRANGALAVFDRP